MNVFELNMLEESFQQIRDRFNASSLAKQQEILIQIDPLAKKMEMPEVYRPQQDVLDDIKHAIEQGGDRARDVFCHSFVSWYRSGLINRVSQLHHWSQLDLSNRRLFIEMLSLRDTGRFDDEALFQFEQFCLGVVKRSERE